MVLFERIPDRLFGPLASGNRHGYWSLLCALHKYRFGPDAPIPPSHGYLLRDITKLIEDHIAYDSAWEAEEGETAETPNNIRAIGYFNRLQEAGWFRVDRYGMERTVSMRPSVSQFLSTLIEFAETDPVFVSGKIRSIDANLSLVAKGEASGDGLREAAEQARNLIVHIRNTGTNVRDLMDALDPTKSTALYVRSFFRDYIEHVFIGDYRELRTREHPLSRRQQIIGIAEHLSSDPAQRQRLLAWYEAKLCAGDRKKAEVLFERDLQRLHELSRIDEFLEHLDDEIRRANRKAIAVLDYHVRSVRPLDHLIKHAISAVRNTAEFADMPPAFGPEAMMCGSRLREPRQTVERPPPAPLRKTTFSPYELARARLMKRAQEARSVTKPKLAFYVAQALGADNEIRSDDLPLETIEQICAYQVLQTVAMARSSGSVRLAMNTAHLAPGFDAAETGTEEEPNPMISGRPFAIKRRGRKSALEPKS